MRRTRRSVLRTGVAGLASGVIPGLAGCSAVPNPFGSAKPGFTDLPHPESGDPIYREWLPAPAELDDDAYGPLVASPAQFRSLGDAVSGRFWEHRRWIQIRLDYLGVGFDDYDWVLLGRGPTAVVAASFDRDAVESAVADAGYEPAGEYRGFALFDRGDVPRAVAVGDGYLVWSEGWDPGQDRDPLSPTPTVRRFVDAYVGDRPRYVDTDEGFDAMTSAVGTPPYVKTKPHGAETFHLDLGEPRNWGVSGILATASAWAFDEDRTYLWGVVTFDEERPVVAQKIRNEIDQRPDRYRSYDSVHVWTEGRNANVLFAVDDGAYDRRFAGIDPSRTVPQITWGYDHDPDAETLTFRHEAGTEVPADDLKVVTGTSGSANFFDRYETVGPGDSLTVDVSDAGEEATVAWVLGDGRFPYQLARYDLS